MVTGGLPSPDYSRFEGLDVVPPKSIGTVAMSA